ncbi:MAG: DUF2163 domain-containing protein, partial [Caulobacteraceae bacterium]
DFLLTSQACVRADLYTITLAGGGVLRYAGADIPIVAGGQTFTLGPPIQDGGVKSSRGVTVSTVDITILADDRHLVGDVQFLDFVEDLGLDGAAIRIDRAFAASWADMAAAGPVGTYIRFSGRFSEAKALGQTGVVVTAASWLDLLSVNLPADVYQTSCLNSLGDAKCAVNLAAYAVPAVVAGATSLTTLGSDLTQAADYFALGKLVFTSGANAGLARTIKAYDGAGNFTLIAPLPNPPETGAAFDAYPGCDLSMATCQQRFANLARFRGQPFIPAPSTGLPT